jgi:hypothetical protein
VGSEVVKIATELLAIFMDVMDSILFLKATHFSISFLVNIPFFFKNLNNTHHIITLIMKN